MKPEKSSLKKAVKAVTRSIKKGSAAVAATLSPGKPAPPAAATMKENPPVKTAPPKTPVVPAILLEGDEPPAPAASGAGQRYALGPVPPSARATTAQSAGELPEAYGTQRLLLAARDPHWLYARWDLTREQQRKYNSLSVDRHLVIRIFAQEARGEPLAQVHVHPESNHWFVHVAGAGSKYVAELGYYNAKGEWATVSTSQATLTPPDNMSDDLSAEFATIPTDIPFTQLMELAQTAVRQNIPLVEVLQQLRASGYNLPKPRGGEKWTPERQRALAAIITMDSVRRVWMGSVEITELIRRQLRQEVSSMGVSQFSVPTSPLGGISSITSLASPFGGAAAESRKGFWFNLNAELILYGATEPDAQVTIGGRVIRLRPDGTFSYRFALPDGEYALPAVAISYDKTDSRTADLKFSRSTRYHGEVGRHPQDARLKPPLVANVA
jgi:uncharacterized protein